MDLETRQEQLTEWAAEQRETDRNYRPQAYSRVEYDPDYGCDEEHFTPIFTLENTQGYSAEQIQALNNRWWDYVEFFFLSEEKDPQNYWHHAKYFQEKISRE